MLGKIIKTMVVGAATVYTFIGAFSAWVLKETVNDIVDGAVTAYNLEHPDEPISKEGCVFTKVMTFLYMIVVFPVKLIVSSLRNIKRYNNE